MKHPTDRREKFPVAHPERVERWRIGAYRRDLYNWLRRSLLELGAASCLLFGRRPDRPSISKGGLRLSASEALNNPDWDNNEPGTDTRFAFAELALQAMLAGELEVTRDSCGRIFVIPSKIFAFALAQGLEMESSLPVVWLEALNEPASADTAPATVSDAREIHEGPAHPSEIQMTTKEPEKKSVLNGGFRQTTARFSFAHSPMKSRTALPSSDAAQRFNSR